MSAPVQRSFASGEISPALYARTDVPKYQSGLRQCRNFIVQRHGGASLRSGTVYASDTKTQAVRCLLIPFIRDSTVLADTFLLEYGDSYIRFYQNGAPVVIVPPAAWANATAYAVGDLVADGGTNYYCTAAHTSAAGTNRPSVDAGGATVWYPLTGVLYEIPTPYVAADLAGIRYMQSGDVITIVHPNYPPRELRRYGGTKWILTQIVFGPSIAAPANLAFSGGAAGVSTFYAVTAVKQGSLEESLAGVVTATSVVPASGTPIVVTWNTVAGAVGYRVYRSTDGKTYGLLQAAGGQTTPRTDTTWTTTSSAVSTGNSSGAFVAATTQLRNPLEAITPIQRAFDQAYTIKFTSTLSNTGTSGSQITRGRVGLYYLRNTDAARIFYGYVSVGTIGSYGTYGPNSQTATIVVPDNGYTSLQIDLVPEVSLDQANGTSTLTIDSSTAPNNAVSWNESSTQYSDNASTTPDFKQAPPTQQALFSSAGNYPAVVGRYQQRLLFASTLNEPEKSWGSRTGIYSSFALSTPLVAQDSISFVVGSNRVNVVKHILDLGRLVEFGSDAVYTIDGDNSGAITPATLNTRKSTAHGIGTLRPLEVDDSALYVQARATIVRDLKPRRANPSAMGAYEGTDLTIFANHLFDGYTIVDWAYQEVPHSVIWAVRSDGILLALTYIKEQEMWAWHRHDTDGVVENVCVLPEGSEDALYLIVRRTINGVARRMVERMVKRYQPDVRLATHMDCALTYDGRHTGTTTVTLTGGTIWGSTEQLTLTASAGIFIAGDVGRTSYYLTGPDGSFVRCAMEGFTSATVITVRPDRVVPVSIRAVALGNGTSFVAGTVGFLGQWAKAVLTVVGLTQLEGKAVSVLADGYVVGSPNNAAYPVRTVSGGALTLDAPAAIITVGLPFIADLETLDLDGGQNTTVKDTRMLVPKIGLYVQSSRGVWAGRSDKVTATAPLAGLNEKKSRALESYDSPPALLTDYYEINTDNVWGHHGRLFVRQVDPLPLTVLSITPIGYLGAA